MPPKVTNSFDWVEAPKTNFVLESNMWNSEKTLQASNSVICAVVRPLNVRSLTFPNPLPGSLGSPNSLGTRVMLRLTWVMMSAEASMSASPWERIWCSRSLSMGATPSGTRSRRPKRSWSRWVSPARIIPGHSASRGSLKAVTSTPTQHSVSTVGAQPWGPGSRYLQARCSSSFSFWSAYLRHIVPLALFLHSGNSRPE